MNPQTWQDRPLRPLPVKLFQRIADFFRGGRDVAALAKWLDLPEPELRDWLRGTPSEPRGSQFTYTRFTIPKRRGGEREIHAPSEALKALLRRVLHRMLNPLPVHPAATGFVPGRSIVSNARPHARQGVVINIDLADFFPSISAERVYNSLRAIGWGRDAARIVTHICTHDGRLPQGAPTSPALSNLVCRRLDVRLAALAYKCGGQYTRYADDLTFSFPGFGWNKRRYRKPRGQRGKPRPAQPSRGLLRTIRTILEGEGFRIQAKKKVRIQRAHQRQTATGLVINRAVNLPRALRRRIRAMQHRERLGQLLPRQQAELRGWESLQGMVERQRSASAGR